MAQGRRVARPFHLRWLVPLLAGVDGWVWISRISVALCVVGSVWFAGWAGLLIVGCAGIVRFNLANPVLVDAPAFALAVMAAATVHNDPYLAVFLVLLAGACKETGPAFAAVWAWHPLLLVGLAVPLARMFVKAGSDPFADGRSRQYGTFRDDPLISLALSDPLRAVWTVRRRLPFWSYVLPWGALLCGLAAPSWQLAAGLTLAYAQLAVATDTVRLYQWAAPSLMVAFAAAVPTGWLLPLVLVHVANPFATEGV